MAALRWAEANGEAEIALRLAVALWRFWITRGYLGEWQEILERALTAHDDERIAPALRSRALYCRAILASRRADFAVAIARWQEASAYCERLGDWHGVARTKYGMAALAETRGDDEVATAHYEAALGPFRQVGDTPRIAESLDSLADAAYRRGHLERAADLAAEALAVSRTVGDTAVLVPVLVGAAQVACAKGDLIGAARLLREAVVQAVALGYHLAVADGLAGCAAVATAAGQAEQAARLLGAAEAIREATGELRLGHEAQQRQAVASARGQLAAATFAAAWEAGRSLPSADAVAEAIAVFDALGTRSAAPPDHGAGRQAADLTPREVDVLRLLVEGRSDREVGEALFISHRTVMIHVANILKKLGVESRTAAAARAVRDDLV